MILDGIIIVLLLIFLFTGYQKGLVSMLLALGLYATSFLLVMYINSQFVFINTPIGFWGQGIVLFIILMVLSNMIVKAIDFEEMIVVGIFSRLLGAIFYGVIFLAIAVLLGVVAVTLTTNGQPLPYTDGSYFLDLVRQAISMV